MQTSSETSKTYRERHPERVKSMYQRNRVKCRIPWRDRNVSSYLCSLAKAHAKPRGLEFDLTKDDIIVPEHCPILGIKLEFTKGRGGNRDSAPSVDRIDNNKGYVKGNVHVISYRANRIKNDATVEELKAIAAYLENLK